jgi:hypothetical protein
MPLGLFLCGEGGRVIQFEALYEVHCECAHACDCHDNEMGERVRWEGEAVEPPEYGVHLEDCADEEVCEGCWIAGLHDPLPFFWWLVENLGAQGGAVVVDGEVVDAWSAFQ